jgi:hypothetical protein
VTRAGETIQMFLELNTVDGRPSASRLCKVFKGNNTHRILSSKLILETDREQSWPFPSTQQKATQSSNNSKQLKTNINKEKFISNKNDFSQFDKCNFCLPQDPGRLGLSGRSINH